jgi:Fur family ferric uptake transcriptional regulator
MSIAESGAAPPDLPRSTAYRILVDRERAGVVRRSNAGDEIARFELDDELIGQHHRLICVRCGSVLDASASATLEQTLDNSVRQLALAQSFVPHDYQPDVLGVCAPCALADPPVPVHQK